MVVNPSDNSKIVSSVFPRFMINGMAVEFVQEFRYLRHILSCKMRDDSDKAWTSQHVHAHKYAYSQVWTLFYKCKD